MGCGRLWQERTVPVVMAGSGSGFARPRTGSGPPSTTSNEGTMSDLYDTDVVLWSEQQADLLRRRALGSLVNDGELDWTNIAEEIESLGNE